MTPSAALDLARRLLDLALDLAPVEVLRMFLDEEAVRRQRALADAAEVVKFAEKP
jgi:hypothetical protein